MRRVAPSLAAASTTSCALASCGAGRQQIRALAHRDVIGLPAARGERGHRRLFDLREVALAGEHRIAHAIQFSGQHRRLGALGGLQKAIARAEREAVGVAHGFGGDDVGRQRELVAHARARSSTADSPSCRTPRRAAARTTSASSPPCTRPGRNRGGIRLRGCRPDHAADARGTPAAPDTDPSRSARTARRRFPSGACRCRLRSVRGYLSKSSFGPNCSRFTKMLATTGSPCWRARRISDRWPSCRLPMVGTKAVRFWPRNWSRNSWIELMTFMIGRDFLARRGLVGARLQELRGRRLTDDRFGARIVVDLRTGAPKRGAARRSPVEGFRPADRRGAHRSARTARPG